MVCAFFSFTPFTSHAKADRHGLIDLLNIFMGKLSEIIRQARLINGSNLLQQDCGFTFQKFTVNNDMCRLCLLFLYRGYGSDNRCRTEPVPDIVLRIDRYLTSFPLGQWEHIFRLCIQPHWNFTTPWFSPGRPPLLRRLAADMPLHARL